MATTQESATFSLYVYAANDSNKPALPTGWTPIVEAQGADGFEIGRAHV